MGTVPWHSRLSQEGTQTTFPGPHQSPSLALDIRTHIGPLLPHPPAGVTQAPETQHRGHQLQAVFRSSGLLSATLHSALSLCWEEGSGHSLLSLLPWMPWLEQRVNPCRMLTAGVVRALGWSWGGQAVFHLPGGPRWVSPPRTGQRTGNKVPIPPHAGDHRSLQEAPRGSRGAPALPLRESRLFLD